IYPTFHYLTMHLSFVSVALALTLAAFATARSGHADLSLEARDYIDELTTRETLNELSTRELLDELSDRLARRGGCMYCGAGEMPKAGDWEALYSGLRPSGFLRCIISLRVMGGARWEIGWAGAVHNAFHGSSSFGVL
ncbi:hypothetical protein DFP72DRAFT_885786, partial [Ephemerocybe angulata]